jgi:hypothetical protein
MKKLLITAMLLLSLSSFSQKVYDLDKPKTETQLIGKATKTEDKATYHEKTYTVYESEKGKLFIIYVNKKGNYSKKYIN